MIKWATYVPQTLGPLIGRAACSQGCNVADLGEVGFVLTRGDTQGGETRFAWPTLRDSLLGWENCMLASALGLSRV